MKDKKDIIRIFLVCVIMLSLGFAFNMEEDHKYLPFMVFMAFVTLMFFLSVISQSNLKRNQQSLFFFFVSLAEMLWLGWVGVTLNWQFALSFMGVVGVTWFLVNLVSAYVRQRSVVVRWNTADTVWKSGGGAEEYLKEIEQCEAELKNDTGIRLVYAGISLNDYISVHKVYLLKEMKRDQECLALLKSTLPKIKNPEVRKALSEIETEIQK